MTQRNKKVIRKRNKKLWCPTSEAMLVDLWQDNISGLRGDRMNSEIHQEMAAKLNIAGYNVSRIDVRTKLDNWKRKYRFESSSSSWTLYERIHSFLGEYNFIDMDDEDMTESTKIETSSWEPKSEDTSCDERSKDPIEFIKEPEVELSNHESLDAMMDSKHVAATNYIRSLLCQLPYSVAQNVSYDIISMCHEEIKKYRNSVD